jgi:hypothetical protein
VQKVSKRFQISIMAGPAFDESPDFFFYLIYLITRKGSIRLVDPYAGGVGKDVIKLRAYWLVVVS